MVVEKDEFFAVYEPTTRQYMHWKGDGLSGCYAWGDIGHASRFDTAEAAMNEAVSEGLKSPEIRRCTVTWRMNGQV